MVSKCRQAERDRERGHREGEGGEAPGFFLAASGPLHHTLGEILKPQFAKVHAITLKGVTLAGFTLHSAPATRPATPSLRSVSPNPPPMRTCQQSRQAAHAYPHEAILRFMASASAKAMKRS